MSKQIQYKPTRIDWIGDIPNHWELNRLKIGITLIKNGVWGEEPKEDDNDIYCVRVADFNRTNMSINDSNLTSRSIEIKDRELRILEYGDLLIERSGGGERQPVGFVVRYTGDYRAVFTNFMSRLKVSSISDSNFLKYVFKAMYDARLNVKSIKQTTGIQNLDLESYLNEIVPYPPVNEQETISNFLDKETFKIDNIIEKKQRLIKLLQEKRQALITNAVTKGLDPNVPMKDSGIPWLGEVPEHWIVTPIKNLVKVKDGTHDTPRYVEPSNDTYPLVTSKDIKNGQITFENAKYIDFKDHIAISKRSDVTFNDIIMPMIGTIGNPVIVTTMKPFSIKNVALFKTSVQPLLTTKLIYYLLQSNLVATQFNILNRGGVQSFVSLDILRNLIVFKVPDSEILDIVNFLDKQTENIDLLIGKIQTQITKLQEYRQALITAAVTGKIDVREKVSS